MPVRGVALAAMAFVLGAGGGSIGCAGAGAGSGAVASHPSDGSTRATASVAEGHRLAGEEEGILRRLSGVDARIARRSHIVPNEAELRKHTMGALLHEDRSVMVNEGALDVFAFEARARALADARRAVEAWDVPHTAPARLER